MPANNVFARLVRGLPWLAVLALASAAHVGEAAHDHKAPARRAPPLAIDAAFAPDGRLWVVATNEQGRLTLLQSRDDGGTWLPPRVLDTAKDRVSATGENRPQIRFGPDGRVVIVYAYEYSDPGLPRHAGEVRLLRSSDGGRTFSLPATIHQDRQPIAHGFASALFDAKGVLHTFWIDKRDAQAAGATRYAGAALYRNVSVDAGETFGPDIKVADHTCECCRIALDTARDGAVVALWRHVFEGNVRDHAFARIAGGAASAPVRASHDDWKIEACPHHGPGLALADGGGFHAVWFGERAGRQAVRYGRLAPDGTPVGDVRELPDDAAEHAGVAAINGKVVIVWRSFDGSATQVRALVSTDDGRTYTPRALGSTPDDNDYPRLLTKADQVFLVWRTARDLRVERVLP